ncbi:MAG TPA: secretin N-terminal domain-containing protein, partial [Pirellulales bacterium]|nr:secretin N-terminal domain-containing protein [Pirellulales bacterium]
GRGGGPNEQQMQQQMQQMMQQMQQQAQQNGGKGSRPQQQQEDKIYLAINRRENSVMALATPDKLAVIEQAVMLLDVPSAGTSPLAALQRVQMYRLVAADPAPIVAVLKDMGNLDPSTRLEVDNVNKAIIVDGPLVDHVTVRQLIEKLDGSARHFEVVQLRKLDADYVAGSIEFLLRGPTKETNRPRYVFGDYRQPDQSKDGGFQVEADTKHNRLLLRVNDIELQEIRALMIKLGEDPFGDTHGDNMRVIHAGPGRDTNRLLEQLQRVWPSLSPAPLELNVDELKDMPKGSRGYDGSKDNSTDNSNSPNKSSSTTNKPSNSEDAKHNESDTDRKNEKEQKKQPVHAAPSATASKTLTVPFGRPAYSVSIDSSDEKTADGATLKRAKTNALTATEAETTETDILGRPLHTGPDDRTGSNNSAPTAVAPSTPPGISITRGPQGLIVTSRDPAALDQFMKLVDELSPGDSRYHVFTLKHTYAKDVASLLETVFSKDAQRQRDNFSIYYFFDEQPEDKKEDRNRLSKREPLRFTADPVTNSILVQGADDDQLAEIKSLVDFYDREEPPDSQSIRRTQIVAVKYAKAQTVDDIIKEVYRDLLSPNDKALVSNNPQQGQQQRPFYSFYDMGNHQDTTNGVPRFKGLLSVGVDATSNSLVVSAPQFLLTDVVAMIHNLDDSTKPVEPVVRVISVGGVLDDPLIKDALKNVADPEAAKKNANASQSSRDDQQRRNRWNNNGRNGQGGGNNNGGNGNNNNQNNNR